MAYFLPVFNPAFIFYESSILSFRFWKQKSVKNEELLDFQYRLPLIDHFARETRPATFVRGNVHVFETFKI